ncbi:hypothetical protein KUCAC02_008687 [Chaenocephalus aceratus]|uniref:Uncharacterized protein n=1 Tax=Chaenocephalus aceratus TaxID=36190 RepID=A0ACB9WR07_CHAAC|nr:hypothetical protein KUCAC02_008687 [Chaenocephalus aceratus]
MLPCITLCYEMTWHRCQSSLGYYATGILQACLKVELSDSTSHTITDAIAGKEYIIQVAAKDTEIGTWSDWSVAVHATPWIEDPLPITSTTEVDYTTEAKTSPIPSSNAPQKAKQPVGGAARLLTHFSPLLLGMLLLFMW